MHGSHPSPPHTHPLSQSFANANHDVLHCVMEQVFSSGALVSKKSCPTEYHAAWHIVNDIEQR